MVKNARWGDPYIDNRDWSTYNDRLVRRGEFYVDLDFIFRWDELLASMNLGKAGPPFKYPTAFIEWMACIRVFFQMPFRQMEGFARKLSEYIPALRAADYSTLCKRIKTLDLSFLLDTSLLSGNVVVAVDSTGIKVSNRGEWMREKWKVRRGWIKVHVMIDVETNEILGLEITDERTSDEETFTPLLNQATERCGEGNIQKVLADGAYDRKKLFNELEKRDIQSGIKTRKNASTKSRGSPYRAECVRDRNKKGGYTEWAKEIGYGMRWGASQILG
jgi:hypothetical protein